ncbi:MAG: hypothetical protein WCT04_03265 [Planctomycetota bacterium]
MIRFRDSKIDAVLSGGVVLGFLAIVAGNLFVYFEYPSFDKMVGRWTIIAGMALGTLGAAAVSARVFWRHRISLAAWMTLFGIHALGMALATQLFNWLHPAAGSKASNPGTNALLLALALMTTLLVRGAVLQTSVANMPNWMALRKENESATPRLWLFAIYWISPLAWWGGILSAITLLVANAPGSGPIVALIVCIAIVTVRLAIRFVLFEKNKYSNWQRSPQGWEKFRSVVTSYGFVLAGIVTFYTYFFMAGRVQDDALAERVRVSQAARLEEIKTFQPPKLADKDNALTIYKLASKSRIPVNEEWLESNWARPEARNEVAKNLTALSYFRQATAFKGVQYPFDLVEQSFDFLYSGHMTYGQEKTLVKVEMRQASVAGNWPLAIENYKATLRNLRHIGKIADFESERLLRNESSIALILAAAVLQSNSRLSDDMLAAIQAINTEHFEERGEHVIRTIYIPYLLACQCLSHRITSTEQWYWNADVLSLVRDAALVKWSNQMEFDSLLANVKIATGQRMDREDTDHIIERMMKINPRLERSSNHFSSNLEAQESLRLLEAAIGVKRYQLKHGTWPNSLTDCVPAFLPAIPPDPNKRGRVIQYESSPPRVYTLGTAGSYAPDDHGSPEAGYFDALALKIKEAPNGNHVLFLGN